MLDPASVIGGAVLGIFTFLLLYSLRRRRLRSQREQGPVRERRAEKARDPELLKAVKKASGPGPLKFKGADYLVVESSGEDVNPRILWAVHHLQCTIASETGRMVTVNWEGNRCSVTLINPTREDMGLATDLLQAMLEEATRVLDVEGRFPVLGVEITISGYNEPDGIRPWNTGSA